MGYSEFVFSVHQNYISLKKLVKQYRNLIAS